MAALPDPAGLSGRRVLVCGAGASGAAAAHAAAANGAQVRVVDADGAERGQARAAALRAVGIDVALGDAAVTPSALDDVDLVVVSPGWAPSNPLLRQAASRGVELWGEVELAWRLCPSSTRWLAVTGTNGKTTTTEMLAACCSAGGLDVATAGNIGTPLVELVTAPHVPAVLAVELSSFQLHWAPSVHPPVAAVLNVADDHLDWHGSREAYAAAKAGVWARGGAGDTAIAVVDDAVAERLLHAAPSQHRVGVTAGEPATGQVGVVDGSVVDRTGPGDRVLMAISELAVQGTHNVLNAAVAATMAAAAGVPLEASAAALRGFRTGAHRLAEVAVVDGVRFVDDSKATNPHAAARAIDAYDRVVWVAGGLNKGLAFDDLVAGARERLVAAVLIGRCADEVAASLARHAPEVPVRRAESMDTAVQVARSLARPGDTVLLAPAAASMDMFRDYAERGEAFAEAVGALEGRR